MEKFLWYSGTSMSVFFKVAKFKLYGFQFPEFPARMHFCSYFMDQFQFLETLQNLLQLEQIPVIQFGCDICHMSYVFMISSDLIRNKCSSWFGWCSASRPINFIICCGILLVALPNLSSLPTSKATNYADCKIDLSGGISPNQLETFMTKNSSAFMNYYIFFYLLLSPTQPITASKC